MWKVASYTSYVSQKKRLYGLGHTKKEWSGFDETLMKSSYYGL